jgi:hypothetical protein
MSAAPQDTLTTTVSAAAVRDAVLDLRLETLRAIACAQDIADRLAGPLPAEPAPLARHAS